MARFNDDEIDALKRTTDLAALIRSRGVELHGSTSGNLVGRCPFHDDEKPSLVVTPGKGLWRCMSPSCGATGNAIQFLMKKDGLSFRHAVELLRAPSAAAFTATPKTVRVLPPPVALDADDKTLLRQVVDYYAERLRDEAAGAAARRYLAGRGLGSADALAAHKLGFADRTLGLRLPLKNRAAGAEIRTRLERLGIYRESGHEHFNGCVVVPILDAGGDVVGLYGRKIVERQSTGVYHLYLPGPHRGLWNPAALQSREVILCEALLDALTFWENGHRNVTAAYGVEGFTEEMENAFVAARVAVVYLAFDRDEGGEIGAEKVAARLMARGIECRRVLFPHGQDANDYARKTQPAGKALGVLLNAAAWLGKGRALPAVAAQKPEVSADASPSPSSAASSAPAPSSLAAKAAFRSAPEASAAPGNPPPVPPADGVAAKEKTSADNVPASGSPTSTPSPASTIPPTPSPASPSLVQRGEHWFLDLADPVREYRVGGLEKTLGGDALKIALRLRVGDRFHLDGIDLARDAERRRFVERAAEETGLHVDLLRRDLARLLFAAEAAQAELAKPATSTAPTINLTAAERAAALDLLRAPDLLARILRDFDACGVVGEETNKLVGYLAAVSRKLANPLAIIVQSTSAAGKSALMEAVLAFVPPEERVKYSALTGQALYYLGGDSNLKHKILAIVEEEGAEKASYALKLLQSEGELSIASTGKDPHTGRMVTQEYRVEGPVMIFLTTTAVDIDEELLNRCLILTVDEGREQTAAIHRLQRERETLAGLLRTEARAAVLALHRNAQRLLRPLRVVNPFAERLTFQDDRTRSRRDHTKYLALIRVITLLHQYQRPVKTATDDHGNAVEYIEVTLDDIAAANRLAHDVLGRCLDEMPPQTRRLLAHLEKLVATRCETGKCERCDVLFTRRELREACGWGDTQLKTHLGRLVELEYVLAHRADHGTGHVYELVYDGGGKDGKRHLPGLLDVEKLRAVHNYDAERSGVNGQRSGVGRPPVGGRSGAGRGEKTDAPTSENGVSDEPIRQKPQEPPAADAAA
ncbi:DNA primase [bacterium]|nr:DNA primase [bacterium]